MWTTMKSLARDESGATATEYALIIGLVAVAIVAILTALGGELVEIFTDVEADLAGVDAGTPPAAD